jgi:cobalt/nickel transport system ATP-binding protein
MSGPVIEVTGLNFAYPRGPAALCDLHFTIFAGERVGLIGPNGAGKTTLFLCLCGVLPVPRGVVRVAGLDPADPAQKRQLPAKAGVVFPQSDDQLFSATLFDDVSFGPLNLGLPAEEVRLRTARAIEQVGLAGLEDRPPFHLSGGQKRRAALAGVLAMKPDVLLLDEPSIYLDPRGRRELVKLVNGLPGTLAVAAHDLEFVRVTCGRVLLIDHGRIVSDGPADALLADAALMDAHGLEVPASLRK